ncbi:Transcription factor iws1 [Tilletia horrida]|nr:Transcription factor iws1 [Tilletia horrida]
MADAATSPEATASTQAVGNEAMEASDAAASASAAEAHEGSAAIAPQQEKELEEGADALQQAADEEAVLSFQPAPARSSRGRRVEGDADDEDADIQPGALEPELNGTQQSKEDDDAEAMDEDLEVNDQDRAELAAELADLDGGGGGDDDGDLRYRPHSILDNDDDGDEEPASERSRKKKKTTHDRSGAKDEAAAFGGEGGDSDMPPMTEKERRMQDLNKRIDQALKAGKKKRGRKQEDVDDIFFAESVTQLRNEMLDAAVRDEEANLSKGLVIEKLKLLPKVMATLQKTHMQQAITDQNLLSGVRRWLEPLPDHSLPALNIQRSFFSVLEKMPIDYISLKMSGLGKIVMFYSMNTKVDPAIRRSADRLIELWSRPILKKSSSLRDRALNAAEDELNAVRYVSSQNSGTQESSTPSSSAAAARVRIPKAVASYSVVPRSAVSAGGSGEGTSQARMKSAAKLRTFKSKLKESKQR